MVRSKCQTHYSNINMASARKQRIQQQGTREYVSIATGGGGCSQLNFQSMEGEKWNNQSEVNMFRGGQKGEGGIQENDWISGLKH